MNSKVKAYLRRCMGVWLPFALLVLWSIEGLAEPSMGEITSPPGRVDGHFLGHPLPGARSYGAALLARMRTRLKAQSSLLKPRTQHVTSQGAPKFTNQLILETSPYLRQHAHNPVQFYPWGDEAFELAKKLDRPVLLSVGYSTCHWCHVMEEESFDDLEIAEFMNRNYIVVKVDREERPDVDALYMNAVQMLTGRGGWPMTVWLTPERKPYFGGTYFPPRDGVRGARFGFLTLLKRLKAVYVEQKDKVAESAQQITAAIQKSVAAPTEKGTPSHQSIQTLYRFFADRFDGVDGGTTRVPKFPSTMPVRMLLRYHRRTQDAGALKMATLSLTKMAAGGIYDHVGGGFHRYSTDGKWLVPHFEKMLYDNALLIPAYLDGFQVSGDVNYARVVREILAYVKRDMTAPSGAFYSATDADSLTPKGHREEGWFFTWTPSELDAVLGDRLADIVTKYYAVQPTGNFEGRSILHTPRAIKSVADEFGMTATAFRAQINGARERLYTARKTRPAPILDTKILTAWNGLMISAHARAALVLDEENYARRGARAAEFILSKMQRDGRLMRSHNEGQTQHRGYLDDYAFFIAGLLDLYEATGTKRWLDEAIRLDGVLSRLYVDQSGVYFKTAQDHEALIAREVPANDGAIPSGNSIQTLNLMRLYTLTAQGNYRRRGQTLLSAFTNRMNRIPAAITEMFIALDYFLDTPKEIIIVAPKNRSQTRPFLDELKSVFVPNRALIVVAIPEIRTVSQQIPLLSGKTLIDGKVTAYVCENQTCKKPTTNPKEFIKQVKTTKAY